MVSTGPSLVVPAMLVYGLAFGIVILIFFIIYIMIGQRDIPSIKVLNTARTKKKPVIYFHFTDGTATIVPPELEPNEKKIHPNYFRVGDKMGLIKFWDASAQASERLDGIIPVYHTFVNMPEAVAVKYAAMIFEIEKICREWGYPWDGIQDLVFYCLSEVDKAGGNRDQALAHVLEYIHVDDESSRERVRLIVDWVYSNQSLINMRLTKPITFEWNAIIRAWDGLVGLTSRNVEQIKICAEELARLDNMGNNLKEILIYALAFIMILGGIFFVSKAAKFI
jgi:hypothetical protein